MHSRVWKCVGYVARSGCCVLSNLRLCVLGADSPVMYVIPNLVKNLRLILFDLRTYLSESASRRALIDARVFMFDQ